MNEIRRNDTVTMIPAPGIHTTPGTFRVVRIVLIRAYADRYLPTRQQRVVSRYAALDDGGPLVSTDYLQKVA